MDIDKLLKDPKVLIGIVAAIVVIVLVVMSGGGTGDVSGNARVDSSRHIETTTSQDTLTGGSVKLGNIGSVGGNLDLSKHDSHNEGN